MHLRAFWSQWPRSRELLGHADSVAVGAAAATITVATITAATDTIDELLRLSAHGDKTAFAGLYDVLVIPLYALTLTRASHGPDAERLLLEMFLVLWESCPLSAESGQTAVSWIWASACQSLAPDEPRSPDQC